MVSDVACNPLRSVAVREARNQKRCYTGENCLKTHVRIEVGDAFNQLSSKKMIHSQQSSSTLKLVQSRRYRKKLIRTVEVKIFVENTKENQSHIGEKVTKFNTPVQDRLKYRPFFGFFQLSRDIQNDHQNRYGSRIKCTDERIQTKKYSGTSQ